jgi:hypothetical protein
MNYSHTKRAPRVPGRLPGSERITRGLDYKGGAVIRGRLKGSTRWMGPRHEDIEDVAREAVVNDLYEFVGAMAGAKVGEKVAKAVMPDSMKQHAIDRSKTKLAKAEFKADKAAIKADSTAKKFESYDPVTDAVDWLLAETFGPTSSNPTGMPTGADVYNAGKKVQKWKQDRNVQKRLDALEKK